MYALICMFSFSVGRILNPSIRSEMSFLLRLIDVWFDDKEASDFLDSALERPLGSMIYVLPRMSDAHVRTLGDVILHAGLTPEARSRLLRERH